MNTYLTQLIQALFATKKAYEKRIEAVAKELAKDEPDTKEKCLQMMVHKGYCEHMKKV